MSDICKLCKGVGEKISYRKHLGSGRMIPVSEYCICKKSEYISDNYRLLSPLGREYLPYDQVNKDLIFDPQNLRKSPNYLITGNESDFLLHVKSILMIHKFADQTLSFYCCRSIDVVQKFYVKQDDGSFPHISSTDKYDLMVFTLGVMEKNEALKSCIAQLVNIRMGHRPTWVYLPRPSLSGCEMEYSPELEEMLKNYKKITLKTSKSEMAGTSKLTSSQKNAANFGKG